MTLYRAVGILGLILAGPSPVSAQDRDSLAAAGVGVYRPAPPPSDTESPPPAVSAEAPSDAATSDAATSDAATSDTDTPAADTAAADTAAADTAAAAIVAADTVAAYAPDTSLTARMDVRRGGGVSRSEFPDLRRTAELAGRHTVFLELAGQTELGKQLGGPDLLTVLAPTDSAFALLPPADLERLRGDRKYREAWLGTVLLDGSLGSRELLNRREGKSLGGETIPFSRERDGWIHAGPARITHPDLIARNGTLHGVDWVILPDTTSASP